MTSRSLIRFRLALLATLLAFTQFAYGQAVTGTLVGTITDASAAVVPGAVVTITEMNTGVTRTAAANQRGAYVFPNLANGVYRVAVEQPGFRKAVRENVEVLVNTTVRVDLELQPGEISESVQVVAEAPLLQTDRADTGRQIVREQVESMPLAFNRNFQALINLVPGATRAFRPHSEFFNPQDSLSTRVNGQSRLSNNLQLEGVDNNHRTGLLSAMIPPIEAIEAVDISTSNYEAELGRAGGAVTNVTLRSGTNEFHGSAFAFNRVSKTAARNIFADSKAPTTYNLFGATFGGPVLIPNAYNGKNRTFFFMDYQGIRDRRGDVSFATIPTSAFRSGDLSAGPTVIYDPATGVADGTGRQPFSGNRVPTDRISPVSQRILGLVPQPTADGFGTNFQKATVRRKNTDGFDTKVDHSFTDNDKISVRYSFQRHEIEDPPLFGLAGGGGKGFAGNGLQRSQSAGVTYTRVFSPSLIMEARAGVLRYRNDAQNADLNTRASDEIGVPGVNVSPFTGGLAGININGFSNPLVGFSASLPWERAETNFNFVNNWTKITGSHTIKWGADVRRLRDDLLQTQTFSPRGRFDFTPGPTSLNGNPNNGFTNSFASFLLDQPNTFGRDLPVIFPAFRQTAVFAHVQDKWQIHPKLTLDLGLRWELWPPATPGRDGGFSNFDPATNRLIVAGVGGNSSNLGRETHYDFFAPRFGFAYRVDDKTVVRGGYGISYVPLPDNSYAFNFPVKQNNAFNADNSFSAAGSLANGFPPAEVALIPPDGIINNAPEQNFFVVPQDYKEGYVQSWNVTFQRALPKNFTLDVGYVANHGVRIGGRPNLNAGLIPGAGAAGQPEFQLFGRRASTTLLFQGTSTNYQSLQVKLDRRFKGGFLMTTAYTYGKSQDSLSGDNGGFANHIFPELNYARSNFDVTHTFVQSFVWDLPFGKNRRWLQNGWQRWVFGDWQVNGIFTSQTGTPLNLTFSNASLNAPGNTNRPDITGPLNKPEQVGRGAFFFDTSNFSAPEPATFGNVGRNISRGPGLVNLDFSVFRSFPLTERIALEFRYESFNFTNTPHFNNPGTTFGNATFGQVTTALQDQRQNQFGLKLMF